MNITSPVARTRTVSKRFVPTYGRRPTDDLRPDLRGPQVPRVNPVVQTVTQPMTQPINTMEGPLIQMPEQLFMDSFPVAEPVAQPVAQPITLQKDQPVGKITKASRNQLLNKLLELQKKLLELQKLQAAEPGAEQAF